MSGLPDLMVFLRRHLPARLLPEYSLARYQAPRRCSRQEARRVPSWLHPARGVPSWPDPVYNVTLSPVVAAFPSRRIPRWRDPVQKRSPSPVFAGSRTKYFSCVVARPRTKNTVEVPRQLDPFRASEPLPILNPSNFVPKNGFPVVKGLFPRNLIGPEVQNRSRGRPWKVRSGNFLHVRLLRPCYSLSIYIFFSFIPLIILVLLSRSLPVATQIRGHIAGPPPPSQLRYVPSFLARE